MRASVWVAQRPVKLVLNCRRRWNLLPVFNLNKRVANSSTVSVNGKALDLWKEIWPTNLVTLPRRLRSLVGQNAG
jgi:hypothetical protein